MPNVTERTAGARTKLHPELKNVTQKELTEALAEMRETDIMTPRSPWNLVVEFNDKHFPHWRESAPVALSNALAGETGEVCSVIKRMMGGGTNNHNHPTPTNEELLEELSDVYIYMILLAEVHGTNQEKFEEAIRKKVTKITKRMEERRGTQ